MAASAEGATRGVAAQTTEEKNAANRIPITIVAVLASLIYALDLTIANVALPHMQASVSASPEQITWALTSYIVALAIMTPLSGWLTGRLGRKRLFMFAVAGFTGASMLCGLATTLPELVLFRFLQGLAGASLMPQSQAILLDINPPEKHGSAMALWGAGTGLGPIMGPLLGGWLTDNLSWRWVFFINLPFGLLALIGVWIFFSPDKAPKAKPFDFLGFGALVMFVGALQLMLDRGPGQDWFSSAEIVTYAILSAAGFWIFVIQTCTTQHPFLNLALVRDVNFITSCLVAFFVGIVLFSTLALMPPMLQSVMGYDALTTGVVTVTRGVGMGIALLLVSRLPPTFDLRLALAFGFAWSLLAMWMMSHFDLSMDQTPVAWSGLAQGFGMGFVVSPLALSAFATVAPSVRPEAAAIFNLIRSLGSSVGISIMQALLTRNTQRMHASLTDNLILSDPVVRAGLSGALDPGTEAGRVALNNEVTRQALMVAYVDDFRLMLVITVLCMVLLPVLRNPRRKRAAGA